MATKRRDEGPAKPKPVSRSKGIKVLVYGIPGAGKTQLIGTSPNALVIRPPTDNTDTIPDDAGADELIVDDWHAMNEAYQFLHQGGHEEYDWVWLDSISLAQDHLLDDVFADVVAQKPHRAGGPIDQGEYGQNFYRLAKWVRDMCGLANAGHFNFGITAHPFEWYDPVKEDDVWAPWIQGKNMSPKITGYMTIVGYLRVSKSGTRTLLTAAEGFVGEDKLGVIPELKDGKRGIIDPTIPKLDELRKKGRRGTSPKRRRRSSARRK